MKGDADMIKTIFASALAIFFLTMAPCHGQFYKYVDKQGNIIFTDDLSNVPADQRHAVEEYEEPGAPAPVAEEKKEPETSAPVVEEIETSAPDQEATAETLDQEADQPSADSRPQAATAPTGNDLNQTKTELEANQAKLDEAYNALMAEKKQLEEDKSRAQNHRQIQAYNERVLQFSEKLNDYNEKRAAFEEQVKTYNAAVAPGNSQPEKKE
jgi:hypothetical protein